MHHQFAVSPAEAAQEVSRPSGGHQPGWNGAGIGCVRGAHSNLRVFVQVSRVAVLLTGTRSGGLTGAGG
ncbi:hypothetical protein JCM9803A_28890 [Rhodococcus erythropolis]